MKTAHIILSKKQLNHPNTTSVELCLPPIVVPQPQSFSTFLMLFFYSFIVITGLVKAIWCKKWKKGKEKKKRKQNDRILQAIGILVSFAFCVNCIALVSRRSRRLAPGVRSLLSVASSFLSLLFNLNCACYYYFNT